MIGHENMNFSELVKTRQSGRSYQERPVEPEKVQAIVESARLAPSASNSQPWTHIIVDEPLLKERVASATFSGAISCNKHEIIRQASRCSDRLCGRATSCRHSLNSK